MSATTSSPSQVLARLDPGASSRPMSWPPRPAWRRPTPRCARRRPPSNARRTCSAAGNTTRRDYDQAEAALRSAESAARPGTRRSRRWPRTSFPTPSCAPTPTASSPRSTAEVGQVVAQAQPVYSLARDGPRDAVFNVHEWALANVATDKGLAISLVSDPAVTTLGDVREISPAVDPSTQTVTVKIGLRDDAARHDAWACWSTAPARRREQQVVLVPWARAVRDRRPAGRLGGRSATARPCR